MRIIDGIYLVGGAGYNLSGGCNVYMIDAGGELILVDVGHEGDVEYVKENITDEDMNPRDVSTLLITHSHLDHAGGAAKAKETFNCRLAAHELTAKAIEEGFQGSQGPFTPAEVELKLRGGETLIFGDIEVEVLDTPGHTREGGDLCYKIVVDGKVILFTGDIAFKCWRGLMGGHPVSAWLGSATLEEAELYLKTLRRLRESVKPDILLPGHRLMALRDGWKELQECIRLVSTYIEENLTKGAQT